MAAACVVFPSALVDLTFIMGWNIHSSLLLFSFGLHEDVGFCITDEGTLRFAGLRVFLSHCKDAQQMLYAFPNSYLLYILETLKIAFVLSFRSTDHRTGVSII